MNVNIWVGRQTTVGVQSHNSVTGKFTEEGNTFYYVGKIVQVLDTEISAVKVHSSKGQRREGKNYKMKLKMKRQGHIS